MEDPSSSLKNEFPLQEFFVGIYKDGPPSKRIPFIDDFYVMEIIIEKYLPIDQLFIVNGMCIDKEEMRTGLGVGISKGYRLLNIYKVNIEEKNLEHHKRFQVLYTLKIPDTETIKILREKRRLKKLSKKT